MRKLAILAAALAPLLGGCVASTCDVPTVTFHWQLQDTSGNARSCASAGVYYVDIYFDGTNLSQRAFCADGGATIDVSGLAPGSYPVTVEGVASDGSIYDRSNAFNVVVGDCGNGQYYPVLGEAYLDIAYSLTPNVCNGGYMWFALYDEVAQNYISVVDSASAAAWKDRYDCPGVTPLTFSVPFGTYTLAWIQEVVNPLTSPVAVQQACRQAAFSVTSPGTATLPVTLVDNTITPTFCAAYP